MGDSGIETISGVPGGSTFGDTSAPMGGTESMGGGNPFLRASRSLNGMGASLTGHAMRGKRGRRSTGRRVKRGSKKVRRTKGRRSKGRRRKGRKSKRRR